MSLGETQQQRQIQRDTEREERERRARQHNAAKSEDTVETHSSRCVRWEKQVKHCTSTREREREIVPRQRCLSLSLFLSPALLRFSLFFTSVAPRCRSEALGNRVNTQVLHTHTSPGRGRQSNVVQRVRRAYFDHVRHLRCPLVRRRPAATEVSLLSVEMNAFKGSRALNEHNLAGWNRHGAQASGLPQIRTINGNLHEEERKKKSNMTQQDAT